MAERELELARPSRKEALECAGAGWRPPDLGESGVIGNPAAPKTQGQYIVSALLPLAVFRR